jgi:hypothetical protein
MIRGPGSTWKAVVLCLSVCSPVWMNAPRAGEITCAPEGAVHFICGVKNAEDLVRVPGTSFVIASDFEAPPNAAAGAGPLSLIDITSEAVRPLFPAPEARISPDRGAFDGCQTPPTPFSSHGLSIRQTGRGRFRLYAVNHGGRESIEIFDLAVRRKQLQVTWRGCVIAPESFALNSVVSLSGGAIAVTSSRDPRPSSAAAERPGAVAIWARGSGWQEKAPNDIAIPNGIETSPDGLWLYVAGTGDHTLNRFRVDGGMAGRQIIATGVRSDNLRWADGLLYLAGPELPTSADLAGCARRPVCDAPFGIRVMDPGTGMLANAMHGDGWPEKFGAATTALKVGDSFWLGTFRGDRIAIVPIK